MWSAEAPVVLLIFDAVNFEKRENAHKSADQLVQNVQIYNITEPKVENFKVRTANADLTTH